MLNAARKERPGITVEEARVFIKPEIWEKTYSHKDYSHVESLTFIFGFDEEGEETREVSFQYLRGTIGTRFRETHLAIGYDELLKRFLKSKHVQSLDKIGESDLFTFYCGKGERNALSTRVVTLEVDLTGKNTIKVEIGVPRGKNNRILEVINSKAI